jgi:hypothetical protein
VKVTITRADILASYRFYLESDPRWTAGWKNQAQSRRYSIAAATGGTILWILFAREKARYGDSLDWPLFLFAVVVVYMWWAAARWMKWTRDRYIDTNASAMTAAPETRYHEGEHELEVLPDRITFQGPHHRLEMAWEAIHRIDDAPSHVFLIRRDSATCIVPKRCLRDAAEVDELVRIARDYHARAGADIGSRLAPFLTGDTRCKSCGYNLRGTSSSNCPECAADLAPLLIELSGSL